ncbi:MAG: precorrin-2 C(20)-methyltransferase [Pseudomonadota bacterium]
MTAEAMGVLHGVGVGPGDPELLTLRAWRLISGAEVLAYPAPLGADGAVKSSLARRIVADSAPEDAEEIVIPLPMCAGDPRPAAAAYDRGATEIAAALRAGRDVITLCEGDPLFYGSFAHLLERLAPHFEVEVTPGVPAFAAAAAAHAQPLALRNGGFAVIPATLDDAGIEARLAAADGAVIMKLGRHLPRIRALLDRLGRLEHAFYAEKIGWAEERLTPLRDAPERAPYFALLHIRPAPPKDHAP